MKKIRKKGQKLVAVHLDAETHKKLKEFAEKEEIPIASILRTQIKKFLKNRKKKDKKRSEREINSPAPEE